MAGDGVMEFSDWMIADALKKNPCVKVPEFPDELTCLKLDESDVSVEWRVYVPKGSECSECKERQGYYLDAETIQRQQEHIKSLKVQLAGITDFATMTQKECDERDELIRDLARRIPWSAAFYDGEWHMSPSDEVLAARIRELGIEAG